MTQFRKEGDPAFPVDTENDNSAASSAGEQNNGEQTQTEDGEQNTSAKPDGTENTGKQEDEGFHNDPAWKKREETWNNRFNEQEQRHTDEIGKLRTEFEEKLTAVGTKQVTGEGEAPVEIPKWFGGNEQQWLGFVQWNKQLVTEAAQGYQKELTAKSDAEQKAIDDATKWFETEVTRIEGDKDLNPQGLNIDRNKLLKFALDNDLVDSKGQWNFAAAFRMMGADQVFQAKKALNEKKRIANATTSESRGEEKQEPVKTAEDFKGKNRPW